MRTCLLLAVTAATAAGYPPAPPPRPKKIPDLPALAGSWVLTRYQSGSTDSLHGRDMRVTIDNGLWTFHIRDRGQPAERVSSKYLMKVDPAARPPRFSWYGSDGKTKQYIGSYAADRDTLSVVFTTASPGDDTNRPTDFVAPRGQDYLIVLKRLRATP